MCPLSLLLVSLTGLILAWRTGSLDGSNARMAVVTQRMGTSLAQGIAGVLLTSWCPSALSEAASQCYSLT